LGLAGQVQLGLEPMVGIQYLARLLRLVEEAGEAHMEPLGKVGVLVVEGVVEMVQQAVLAAQEIHL
jgi:hypothetical protein